MVDPVSLIRPLPIGALFLGTLLVLLVFAELGYHVGRWRVKRSRFPETPQAGTITGAALGLLAFMLAFTFGLAANRFDARKQNVIREANAVGTTFLRADYLAEPYRTEARGLLTRYVEARLDPQLRTRATFRELLVITQGIHDELWKGAAELARDNPRSVPLGLYIYSLNEMIDMHTEQLSVAVYFHIAPSIWYTLYFIAFVAMLLLGMNGGLNGTRAIMASVLLAVTLSAVFVLIADLDQPAQRFFNVSQQALADLLESMKVAQGR